MTERDAPREDIVITRYPAARGALWLREAFTMFRAARMPWLLLVVLYYVVMLIVEVVPVIGHVAVPLLKPVFAVGFLAAAWGQERGHPPHVRVLFRGFTANLRALLPLGFFLLVGATLSVMATMLVDDGTLIDALSGRTVVDQDTLASGRLQAAMALGAACALPLLMAMWYAPALVVFHACTASRALLWSLRASLINWRALALYGMLVLFYGAIVPGLAMAAIAMIAPSTMALTLALALSMPYFLVFITTLHISDYVSYRDIFHAHETGMAEP